MCPSASLGRGQAPPWRALVGNGPERGEAPAADDPYFGPQVQSIDNEGWTQRYTPYGEQRSEVWPRYSRGGHKAMSPGGRAATLKAAEDYVYDLYPTLKKAPLDW
jgi:hypothetical protein